MTRELTFEQIEAYLFEVTNYPIEVLNKSYVWDDSRLVEDFSITFNILPHPTSEVILETITIDMFEVWRDLNN